MILNSCKMSYTPDISQAELLLGRIYASEPSRTPCTPSQPSKCGALFSRSTVLHSPKKKKRPQINSTMSFERTSQSHEQRPYAVPSSSEATRHAQLPCCDQASEATPRSQMRRSSPLSQGARNPHGRTVSLEEDSSVQEA